MLTSSDIWDVISFFVARKCQKIWKFEQIKIKIVSLSPQVATRGILRNVTKFTGKTCARLSFLIMLQAWGIYFKYVIAGWAIYMSDFRASILACKGYKTNTKALKIIVFHLILFFSVFRPLGLFTLWTKFSSLGTSVYLSFM